MVQILFIFTYNDYFCSNWGLSSNGIEIPVTTLILPDNLLSIACRCRNLPCNNSSGKIEGIMSHYIYMIIWKRRKSVQSDY